MPGRREALSSGCLFWMRGRRSTRGRWGSTWVRSDCAYWPTFLSSYPVGPTSLRPEAPVDGASGRLAAHPVRRSMRRLPNRACASGWVAQPQSRGHPPIRLRNPQLVPTQALVETSILAVPSASSDACGSARAVRRFAGRFRTGPSSRVQRGQPSIDGPAPSRTRLPARLLGRRALPGRSIRLRSGCPGTKRPRGPTRRTGPSRPPGPAWRPCPPRARSASRPEWRSWRRSCPPPACGCTSP